MITATGAAMGMINRLAAFWLVIFAAVALGSASPASARTTADYRAELDAVALEMRALWGEIERFEIQQRYCLPPYTPVKQPDTMLMQAYSARAEALRDKYEALKQSLKDFLATNTRLHAELMIAGKDPSDRGWFDRWDNSRDKMIKERDAKRDALAKAPERDCTPRAKPAIAVQPPPPLVLPQRPQIPPFNWPALPSHFCSELEKLDWKIANINPQFEREAFVALAVARYRSQVEGLVNDHVQANKPIPPALAEARRQAIALSREWDRIEKANQLFYRRFAAVPIIDCGPKPPKEEPPRTDVRPPEPAKDPPKADVRTGMSELDAQRVAGQQEMISEAESMIAEIDRLRRAGKCAEAEALYQRLRGFLFTMTVGSYPNADRKNFPAELIERLRRQSDAALEPCPPEAEKKPGPSQTGFIPPPDPRMRIIYDEHNKLRAEYKVDPLKWDPALAAAAQAYAERLAGTGQLAHAPREGRGITRENLSQGMLHWGPRDMVRNWVNERARFHPGYYPDVSTTGRWEDVSHFTQMIWPQTTDLGCGMADGSGSRWLVCRYSPGGNKDGKPVGQTIADGPKTPAQPPAGDIAPVGSPGAGIAPVDSQGRPLQPPPPPPPNATNEAPDGDESRHPLVGYANGAYDAFMTAWRNGDRAAQEAELAKMRYAFEELRKRGKAARKMRNLSTVDPNKVAEEMIKLDRLIKDADRRLNHREEFG